MTVIFKPFKNHTQCSAWHLAFDDSVFDIHDALIVTIPCMEMRWLMVREVHPNVYSVKETNLWHNYYLFF